MSMFIVFIFICLVLMAGSIVLQIFLSRLENKWLGLILPILYGFIAAFISLGGLYVRKNALIIAF